MTAQVNAAAQAKYGRTTLQPGESVAITGIEIYSLDLSIPQVTSLYSLFADPPGGTHHKFDAYDFNKDGRISDSEILKAVHDWAHNDMDDFALLNRIQMWKNSPHRIGAE